METFAEVLKTRRVLKSKLAEAQRNQQQTTQKTATPVLLDRKHATSHQTGGNSYPNTKATTGDTNNVPQQMSARGENAVTELLSPTRTEPPRQVAKRHGDEDVDKQRQQITTRDWTGRSSRTGGPLARGTNSRIFTGGVFPHMDGGSVGTHNRGIFHDQVRNPTAKAYRNKWQMLPHSQEATIHMYAKKACKGRVFVFMRVLQQTRTRVSKSAYSGEHPQTIVSSLGKLEENCSLQTGQQPASFPCQSSDQEGAQIFKSDLRAPHGSARHPAHTHPKPDSLETGSTKMGRAGRDSRAGWIERPRCRTTEKWRHAHLLA